MKLEPPKVTFGDKKSHHIVQLTFYEAGSYQLSLTVQPPSGNSDTLRCPFTPGRAAEKMKQMGGTQRIRGMKVMTTKATFGDWSKSRQGSCDFMAARLFPDVY